MGVLERMAEARIRQWQERRPEERTAHGSGLPTETLEVQLLNDIVALRDQITRATDDTTHQALTRTARELEVRLMILLEQSGRPLAAQQLSERLSKTKRDE